MTGWVAGPSLAATYLSLVVLLPIAAVFSQAFNGGISQMWSEIRQPETFAALRLATEFSFIVIVVNAVSGTVIAWVLVRERFVLNRVISILVDLPFALPTVIAGLVLISIYGPASPVHVDVAFSRWSIVLALAFVTLPFSVRSVQPVLASLDRDVEDAAASLGAGAFTTFRRVILPSLLPAIITGAGLGFARAIGEYGAVVLLTGDEPFKTELASVRIYGLIESYDLPSAAAASLALFVIAIVALSVFAALRRHPDSSGGFVITRWSLRLFSVCFVGLLVGLPMGTIIVRALRPGLRQAYDAVFNPIGEHALVLTLEETALAVALNTIFGLGMALVLARHRFRGASLVELLIDIPLGLSPIVVGLAILLFYSSTQGWIGPWLHTHGINVLFAFPGIVAASAFVSLPYVVREVLPVLQELGTEQEQAAETLGAGPIRTFVQITLPAIRWGLTYGVVLTTARILGEYGAVSIVSGNLQGKTQTFTQFVGTDFQNFDTAGAYAGALVLAMISIAILGLLSISRRKEQLQ